MLTRLVTGCGGVKVDSLEGNLHIEATGALELGKVMGEQVSISTSGERAHIKALYAKEVSVSAAILFRPPTHFSHMSHPTFPMSHILILFSGERERRTGCRGESALGRRGLSHPRPRRL